MNPRLKSLSTSIARTDFIFMSLEALALYIIIDYFGSLTGIFFIGKGSVVVTISYFLLSIFFFSTPTYKMPFLLLSGFEHYSKVTIDLLKIFTVLAFEFFIFDLQAGRAFFIFALPVAVVLRLLSRKILKMIFAKRARAIPVIIFTDKNFIEDYLKGFFANTKVFPQNDFRHISESFVNYSNSLVLLHGSKDFSREHDLYTSYAVSKGVTFGYLDSYTRVRGRTGLRIVLGALVVLIKQPLHASCFMRYSKRLFDLIISSLLIFFLLPIVPWFYILYVIKNGLPFVYQQSRIGLNGDSFTIYKIRTVSDHLKSKLISESNESSWVSKPDQDALVPWGNFLRRWSIDELPQLINVLKGDMSIVGPRPRLESEEHLSGYRIRLTVRPGLTGLWQISGRNIIGPQDGEELDDYYVDHWSLLMDIQICVKTLSAIKHGLGAR